MGPGLKGWRWTIDRRLRWILDLAWLPVCQIGRHCSENLLQVYRRPCRNWNSYWLRPIFGLW